MDSFLFIALGVLNILLTSLVMFRKGFAEKYVTTSPKAWLWRKLFGETRAVRIIKHILAPLGFLLGMILFLFGIASLFI